MMELLESVNSTINGGARRRSVRIRGPYFSGLDAVSKTWSRILFEHGLPEPLLTHADQHYHFNWDRIIRALESGEFFTTQYGPVVPETELPPQKYEEAGQVFLAKMAAIVVVGDFGPTGPVKGGLKIESLVRSLEHDGLAVDMKSVKLVPIEGPVTLEEEQNRLEEMIDMSGLPGSAVAKKHLQDAAENYLDGTKDHSSLGESRALLQCLVDDSAEQIANTGRSQVGLPGGTANRLDYLERNNFLAPDEKAAFGAAWGFLSAGAHPGMTPREQARMGMVLSMEFSQMLIQKWLHWRAQHS
jgi:hypothetical protein